MLQLKQISKLLSQGLTPVSTTDNSAFASIKNSPLSISLLSSEGIALTTVVNSTLLQELNLSSDNLKIYSLIGYNYLHQRLLQFYLNPSDQEDEELVSWTIIQLENELKLVIQKLDSKDKHPLFVILFYHQQFPDEFAKLKSDGLTEALNLGFRGYFD